MVSLLLFTPMTVVFFLKTSIIINLKKSKATIMQYIYLNCVVFDDDRNLLLPCVCSSTGLTDVTQTSATGLHSE